MSVTDFRVTRPRDLPGAYLAGLRLRRGWPTTSGAVGLRLWARPLQGRSGAISVWRDEAALRSFLASRAHLAIVRAYRTRAAVTSEQWRAPRFAAAEIEGRALRGLNRRRSFPPASGG